MVGDARIGTVVAGYRIESLIGRGGMSVVYLAHHEGLERKAALKLLAPELAENDAFRQRFIRESRIAAGLDHPNVIPVYDAGEADGLLFIAMRYVRGSDLRSLLAEQGPLDLADVVRVMDQLGAALDAAHEEGLVHRDVKPANVLLSPATPPAKVGHLYLADFGLTKKSLSGSEITRSGQFVGTIDYVAPEQIRSEHVDGRADVYSLGCLLYQCLTGAPPFVRETEVAVMFAHLNDPPPEPTAARPGLPPAIDAVVARAMAKGPGDRFQTPGDLARAAHDALRPALAGPYDSVAPPTTPNSTRRKRTLVGGIGVALVAAVAVILAVVTGGNGSPGASGTPTPSAPSHAASVSPSGASLPTGFGGVARLDPRTGSVAHTVPLALAGMPAPPGALALRPLIAAEGAVWVAGGGFTLTQVLKIDPGTGREEDRIVLRNSPTQTLTFAAGQSSLWVLTNAGIAATGLPDVLYRIDPGNDRVLASIPIGATGVGVAADRDEVWVARSDGILDQIDTGTNAIAKTIDIKAPATSITLAGGAVWVSDVLAGVVYRVDPDTAKKRTIAASGSADGIAADATTVWVIDRTSGNVTPIDAASGNVGQSIRVGADPSDVAVGSGFVWVTDEAEGSIYRVDPGAAQADPYPVAQDPGPGRVSVGEGAVWVTVG
jgi:serine/threonine protein kinase